MAEYGLLQEIQVQVRDTSIAVAASISDTELLVDNAGDFSNEDADEGGVLSLNGALLEYTGVEWGIGDEDPDTILLAAPLAVAADVGDDVAAVIAGLVAEDWYAVVDHNGGDVMVGPLNTVERAAWPQGVYASVPVMFSEDLTRLQDAPGRPASASSRVAFHNTDALDVDGPGDTELTLTYKPLPGSLHVRWGALEVPAEFWSLAGRTLSILDPNALFEADDQITTAYAYDVAAATLIVNEEPEVGGVILTFEASGWKYLEVGRTDPTDYSAPGFDDSGWATGTAAFGEFNGGWSGVFPTPPAPTTDWPIKTRLWLRRTIAANPALDLNVDVRVEDSATVYLNGVEVGSIPGNNQGATVRVTVPAVDVLSSNVLAIRATDDTHSLPNGDSYIDAAVSQ